MRTFELPTRRRNGGAGALKVGLEAFNGREQLLQGEAQLFDRERLVQRGDILERRLRPLQKSGHENEGDMPVSEDLSYRQRALLAEYNIDYRPIEGGGGSKGHRIRQVTGRPNDRVSELLEVIGQQRCNH